MKASWLIPLLLFVVSPAKAEFKWRDYRLSENVDDRRPKVKHSEYGPLFGEWASICTGLGNSAKRLMRLSEVAIAKEPALAQTDVSTVRKEAFHLAKSCIENRESALAYHQKISSEIVNYDEENEGVLHKPSKFLDSSQSQKEAAKVFSDNEQQLSFRSAQLSEFLEIIVRKKTEPSALQDLLEKLNSLNQRAKNIFPLVKPRAQKEIDTIKMRLGELTQQNSPQTSRDSPYVNIEDYRAFLIRFAEIIIADRKKTLITLGRMRAMKAKTLSNEKGLENLGSPL